MRVPVGRLLVVVVVLVIGATTAGRGAEPPSSTEPSWRGAVWLDQWRDIQRSRTLDVPTPITKDEEVQRVTLREAIAIALENNPGIAARRLEPRRFDTNVLEAQAQFDPLLTGELSLSRSVTPNASALSSTSTN